jgi:ribonuclease-3
MKPKLSQLQKAIGIRFRDHDLLARALTHRSFACEQKSGDARDYEVLEFLGDSVVGLAVADFLCEAYPNLKEGDLSKYKAAAASTLSLSEYARQINLDKYVLLGKGEEKSGGRRKKTILAGAFEALTGAIYKDQGYEIARGFLLPLLQKSFQRIDGHKFLIDNYKSALQEYFQKENLPAPVYRTVTSVGPDHRRTFTVQVYLGQDALAKASGPSKKSAEQKAAQKALKSLWGRRMKVFTPETFVVKK